MYQGTMFPMAIAWASGSTTTTYFPVPFKCTIRNAVGTCQGDPGDAEDVTLKSGSDTVATLTWGTGIAAGAVATFSRDTTNGDTEFAVGSVITVVASNASAAVAGLILLDLDPHCLTELDRDS